MSSKMPKMGSKDLAKLERKAARQARREQRKKLHTRAAFVPLRGNAPKIPAKIDGPSADVSPTTETKAASPLVSKAMLMVGDGDLSFAVALANVINRPINNDLLECWPDIYQFDTLITSSVLLQHQLDGLYEAAHKNRQYLEKLAFPHCRVWYALDATAMRVYLPLLKDKLTFDCVVFNFPLVGHDTDGTPREQYFDGNRKLLRGFFASVSFALKPGGTVRVTLCNRQETEFELQQAAQMNLFYCADKVAFQDELFPDYHRKRATNDAGWEAYENSSWTFVFKRAANKAELADCIARHKPGLTLVPPRKPRGQAFPPTMLPTITYSPQPLPSFMSTLSSSSFATPFPPSERSLEPFGDSDSMWKTESQILQEQSFFQDQSWGPAPSLFPEEVPKTAAELEMLEARKQMNLAHRHRFSKATTGDNNNNNTSNSSNSSNSSSSNNSCNSNSSNSNGSGVSVMASRTVVIVDDFPPLFPLDARPIDYIDESIDVD